MTDLRQRTNGPWEPDVTIESTDGSSPGPFGPAPWTVRAANYTDHGLFARVISEWNFSVFFAQNYALRVDDSPSRSQRRSAMNNYIELVQREAAALAGETP